MCIKSYNKKFFVEMIFHFLLTNDLFHRRGQKMVPIHFCNYIHWDTFLTKFYTFCSKCTIEPFFTRFFCNVAIERGKNILFFRKILRKKSENLIFFWERVIRRRFFLWNFPENFQKTVKTPLSKTRNKNKKRYRFSMFERNLLKFKYFLISINIVILQISLSV